MNDCTFHTKFHLVIIHNLLSFVESVLKGKKACWSGGAQPTLLEGLAFSCLYQTRLFDIKREKATGAHLCLCRIDIVELPAQYSASLLV